MSPILDDEKKPDTKTTCSVSPFVHISEMTGQNDRKQIGGCQAWGGDGRRGAGKRDLLRIMALSYIVMGWLHRVKPHKPYNFKWVSVVARQLFFDMVLLNTQ